MTSKIDKKSLKERLQKLYTMSLRGEPTEQAVASLKLQQICKAHNINPDTIFTTQAKLKRFFKVANWSDFKDITIHCILAVDPFAEIEGVESKRRLIVYLTNAQFIRVRAKFAHYWPLYTKERYNMMCAFIIQHNLGISFDGTSIDNSKIDVDGIVKYIEVIQVNESTINQNKSILINAD